MMIDDSTTKNTHPYPLI